MPSVLCCLLISIDDVVRVCCFNVLAVFSWAWSLNRFVILPQCDMHQLCISLFKSLWYPFYIPSVPILLLPFPLGVYSARNNSWSLAIFQPISAFGRPKSILAGQISCTFSMGTGIRNLKISYFQKTANQFLILISSTVLNLTWFGPIVKFHSE